MRQGVRFQAGFLAAMLAVSLQLVLWMGMLAGAFGQMQPDEAARGGIVYVGHCSTPADQAPHKHVPCALCPICLTASLPQGVVPASPVLLPPSLRIVLQVMHAFAARAPPAAPELAAYPRGPPTA